ncbi:SUMO1 sentrin specific peptidase 8 [Nowakowskiella sp. JEL0407]|nr:SUMO1 sentrin specific peptidase 8 [Nowakowskiella sp. JEL0407]
MKDAVVLSFGDVLIRESDFHLLNDGQWLNDTIIEYRSSISFALPPELNKCSVIFIPVNDNEDDASGGSHWSLMVFHRPSLSFYVYDSLNGMNTRRARKAVKKMTSIFGILADQFTVHIAPLFVEVNTPIQINFYDCGMYVVTITERLSERLAVRMNDIPDKPGDLSAWKISHSMSPQYVNDKRKEIANLIISLKRKTII